MRASQRWIARAAVIGGAAALTLPLALAAGSAGASGGATGTRVPITGGVTATQLKGATSLGVTPSATHERVDFVLKPQDATQLSAEVEQGVTSYLTPAQFAAQYGQSPAYIASLRQYLSGYGIASTVAPNALVVRATGTAGAFDTALDTHQDQFHVAAHRGRDGEMGLHAQTVHALTAEPSLPASLAQNISAAPGLTDYSAYVTNLSHVSRAGVNSTQPAYGTRTHTRTHTRTKGSSTCLTGALVDADACHTPSYFATQYGLSALYQQGDEGQGQTIGIVTLAALNPTAPSTFWSTDLHLKPSGRTVTIVTLGAAPPSAAAGSGETDLDTEQSGALAPDANIVVYQTGNTTATFVNAFFYAATQDVASTVSVSWAESETIVKAFYGATATGLLQAFDTAFEELAMQGQSVFGAAGDSGAYAARRDLGSSTLSVNLPVDSPYITVAGGTTTPWSGVFSTTSTGRVKAPVTVRTQRSWSWDYAWPAMAKVAGVSEQTEASKEVVGGGGGYSTMVAMPSYQVGVFGTSFYSDVQELTPTNDQTIRTHYGTTPTLPTGVLPWTYVLNPYPRVGHGYSSSRAMPDVSADADPFSGYLLYAPTTTTTAMTLAGGWGGTSFVAPQLNGATAVIDSAVHHRVGLWNPSIYKFATGWTSPFTPLDQTGTQNDNLYYTGTPGTVYNAASGLGVPNLTQLEADFAYTSGTPTSGRHGGHGGGTGPGNPRHHGNPPHGWTPHE
ncbi:MAG: S53 family peptidase [Acidimicrobiales bacterium]